MNPVLLIIHPYDTQTYERSAEIQWEDVFREPFQKTKITLVCVVLLKCR